MGDTENISGLPVQTVRKISVDNNTGSIQFTGQQSENIVSSDSQHVSKVISELVTESNITRNDSYSKFGLMETVSLDLGEQTDVSPSIPIVASSIIDNDQVKIVKLNEKLNKTDESVPIAQYFAAGDNNQKIPIDDTAQSFSTVDTITSLNQAQIIVNMDNSVKSVDVEKGKESSSVPSKHENKNEAEEIFAKVSINARKEAAIIMPQNLSYVNEASLLSLANKEISEAWIPSENTRHALMMMITSTPGTYIPERHHFTTPSIIIEEEMEDPLKLLLQEINPPVAQERKVLTADDVAQNEDGLKKLIDSNCYHAAINLTGRLLNNLKKSSPNESFMKHSPLSLRIWFIRIALFVKLRKFSYAEVESEAFGDFDKPDLYLEFYPDLYHNKKGSMVPFPFRLLLAELPQYQGNHQTALNNLYCIINIIQKIIKNLEAGYAEDGSTIELTDSQRKMALELWQQRECRVLYSILNCFFTQRDYIMSVSIIQNLLKKDKDHIVELYSSLGRIYLQLGDMKQARNCFNFAAIEAEKSQNENQEVEKLINKALLSITHNENEEAYKTYEQALQLQPDNSMLVNNMAVCLLYMGRLKESLVLLEKTIQKNPAACLHDGILFNVCTLYELESSHCTLKKQAMLNLVSKYAGDNFLVSCLKIPPNVKV